MSNTIYAKDLNKILVALEKSGRRKTVQKVRAAIAEQAMAGTIKSVERTHHGESRLPNCEKYDLGDGYRLVVQVLDGPPPSRVFLFVGTHDKTEQWLDNHRGYKWVKNDSDGSIAFTQITTEAPSSVGPSMPDITIPVALLDLPLLRDLTTADWDSISAPVEAKEYANTITRSDWETDSTGVWENTLKRCDYDTSWLFYDLYTHAYNMEWDSLHSRIALSKQQAHESTSAEAVTALADPANSETFITWNEDETPPDNFSWEDWMLFLQPLQRDFAKRDFNGPARLRGVSGSGKTCVVVHRARYLALKYKMPTLIVTLTQSMRQLLDVLVTALCGVESTYIRTCTVNQLATQTIAELHPHKVAWFTIADDGWTSSLVDKADAIVVANPDLGKSSLKQLDQRERRRFLLEEINYVRGRLMDDAIDDYVDTKLFRRTGRGIALSETDRQVILPALRMWRDELRKAHRLDFAGVVQEAVRLLSQPTHGGRGQRCVLVDEVQDLSQLELEMIGKLATPQGQMISSVENGLFLVGDGAQTIYRRGFSLAGLGINIANRSFCLKKNYRNTKQILTAAFGLIQNYKFADVDEDNIASPTQPEFASRNGERPVIVRCTNMPGMRNSEAVFVANEIKSRIETGVLPAQICVIGCSPNVRQQIAGALGDLKIDAVELRQDAEFDTQKVKFSTIESAKGHEFQVVLISGITEGHLPYDPRESELPREAARFYVAMTRARDVLYMTYTSAQDLRPSQFLSAIQNDCDELAFDGKEIKVL